MTIEQRLPYLMVRPASGGPWATVEPHELIDMLDGDETEIYQIRLTKLTKAEIEALPEFHS